MLKPLPASDEALVIRTDFSDPAAWETVRAAIRRPVDGFRAYVHFVDDVAYDGVSKAQLLGLFDDSVNQSFVVIVDRMTLSHPDHPVLVVDVLAERGAEFRAVPSQVQSIENNLSTANMDFEEFAACVDANGVFRGFPDA